MYFEVILDPAETANKCTIVPLGDRPDFKLHFAKGPEALGPLQAPVLLHPDGRCLTELRSSLGLIQGIALIDCVWKKLDPILRRVAQPLPVLARIPDGFVTAYPRVSESRKDPEGGLATIEALFVASALLGHWDVSLFSRYYFGRRFVELNLRRLQELGVTACSGAQDVPMIPRTRTSKARRLARGKRS